jgi:hypothetical protein
MISLFLRNDEKGNYHELGRTDIKSDTDHPHFTRSILVNMNKIQSKYNDFFEIQEERRNLKILCVDLNNKIEGDILYNNIIGTTVHIINS